MESWRKTASHGSVMMARQHLELGRLWIRAIRRFVDMSRMRVTNPSESSC